MSSDDIRSVLMFRYLCVNVLDIHGAEEGTLEASETLIASPAEAICCSVGGLVATFGSLGFTHVRCLSGRKCGFAQQSQIFVKRMD